MPFSISPIVGIRIGEVDKPAELQKSNRIALGTIITADDGHDYVYAQASGAIANAAVAILTEPAMTMATGAGAWTNNNAALIALDRAWFKKTVI
jgi:hypothetical protein